VAEALHRNGSAAAEAAMQRRKSFDDRDLDHTFVSKC